ncbi:MAG: glycosyl hydrolase 115 family protein [Candidatus Marinimicrobia bacterium]|nr:glycosyl hydrolase 115 family protein [Candidatus Neomarinimicrobiota bacterium]
MKTKKTPLYHLKNQTLSLLILLMGLPCQNIFGASPLFLKNYISDKKTENSFTLAKKNSIPPVYASSKEHSGVMRVIGHFRDDVQRVTGKIPDLVLDGNPEGNIVLIGTLGKNHLIDDLISQGKINSDLLKGKRETFLIQVVSNPFPNINQVLVIAGSDKRGTIYGIFDLSEKIGVSPWYFWSDVPVQTKSEIYIQPGTYTLGEPKVRYRGIFLNDEMPALGGWADEFFGGFTAGFYQHVFELVMRLKGNFLWPAMWGRAFYDDDPKNAELADEYGIVISTSHHEPMMRAHDEWRRYGTGPWNYEKNASELRRFWRNGIERMGDHESVVTLAMRGDGDEPMSEEANVALLQTIVKDQREILVEVTGQQITDIPQVWALYKEVQDYYDRGMRVPDDVTLLLCDDNWGNIRKFPQRREEPRAGGYGIYYHVDYVGGPRNYKWLNTSQVSRIWEQMHLAWAYGANQIWVLNVGDLKPMELPISFFLDYAWDPSALNADQLPKYTESWACRQFGPKHATEIAHILTQYTTYNSRRKPEMLEPKTYSLTHYREAEQIVENYNQLLESAKKINHDIPGHQKDAFYQLVLHPVAACANLNELTVTVAKNHLYAEQKRAAANDMADRAIKLFVQDSLISWYYNNELAGGKWHHMMDQTHIGYTYWQQPEKNVMPEIKRIQVPRQANMGVAVEGSGEHWPKARSQARLPEFDVFHKQIYYIEIFNQGSSPFQYKARASEKWLKIDNPKGTVNKQKRIFAEVIWKDIPPGDQEAFITLAGTGRIVKILCKISNPKIENENIWNCHIEANNYIAMEAKQYHKKVETDEVKWQEIPDLGKTKSAMHILPVTTDPLEPESNHSPNLQYALYLKSTGKVKITAYLSPTLNFHNSQGLRYGISLDNEKPQILNMHADRDFRDWEISVGNNITLCTSEHEIRNPGFHTLKFWALDPGVVLQKIVVETGKIGPSYLGPQPLVNRK